MEERLVDIIVYLLEEFQESVKQDNYVNLSKKLISRGYTEDEINFAFSWIANSWQDRHKAPNDDFHYSEDANRILHDVERLVIDAQAFGYLLQMRHLGLLSDSDLEVVIDKALSLRSADINVHEIKSIVASIIFGMDSDHDSWSGFLFPRGSNTIH